MKKLLALFCAVTFAVHAYADWSLSDDGVLTITSNYSYDFINGYPWYKSLNDIKSVVIGDGVSSIGDYAFYNCSSLTSITIPSSVTSIGDDAFAWCSGLTSITIPENSKLTSIGNSAFYKCSSLTSITIPSSVTSIGDDAFAWCSGLTRADYGGTIADWLKIEFGDGYSNPCGYAHHLYIDGNEVKDVVIPDGVTSIGDYAFSGCSGLTSINIPDGVTSIGDEAFKYCSGLTSVSIPDGVTSIGEFAFYGCSSLTGITIPESVTSIENHAFSGCSSLTSITIPDGVTSIGNNAFSGCSSLTSITIPESVTSIGNYAFSSCSSLTSIIVDPNNVNYDSRDNCNAIIKKSSNTLIAGCQNTVIPNNVTSIGETAFYNCSSLTSITIPSSVTSIGDYAFAWCSGLTSITIPSSVTSIGDEAFMNCSGLTSITIPSSVTSIGDEAFMYCSGLTSITIPSSVTSIGNSAFYYCYRLTSITIPESVTSIGSSAFYDCIGLTSINIPESVTSIGEYAFEYCRGLTSITIPSGVKNIERYAFSGCSGLTSITIPEGVTSIGSYAFSGCSGLTSITIPEGVTSIGSYAFERCSGLTSITIPEGVTSIGEGALRNCSNLIYNEYGNALYLGNAENPFSWLVKAKDTNITSCSINRNAKVIYNSAFSGCSSLTSVTIPKSVTSIGEEAFVGCSNINELHIGSIESWCKITTTYRNSNPLCVTSSKDVKLYVGDEEVMELVIPEGVTDIKNGAFINCSGLTGVVIPDGVTSIGNYAFEGCSGLTSITIPGNVTNIGNGAFKNCSGMTSATIQKGVTSIGRSVFDGCVNLTSVIIPCTVTHIGYSVSPTCYVYVMGENVDPVVAQAEGGVFKITSPAGAENVWDTMFWIGLDKACPEGTEYYVSFDYKASSEVSVSTLTYENPGYYLDWHALGELNFTKEWQTLEFEGTSTSAQNGMKSFGFCLSTDRENDVTFEIRNISVVVNGVPCGKDVLQSFVFSGCDKLDRLTSLAAFPPEIGPDIFEESGLLSGGVVFIPEGTTASYQDRWGTELNYVELTDLPQIKDGVGGKAEVVAKDYMQVTLYITIESGYVLGDIIVNGSVVYSANKAASDVTVIRNADGTYTLDGVSSTDVIEVTFNKSGNGTPTDVEDILAEKSQKVIKSIEDGRLVILRDGVKYDIMGRRLIEN